MSTLRFLCCTPPLSLLGWESWSLILTSQVMWVCILQTIMCSSSSPLFVYVCLSCSFSFSRSHTIPTPCHSHSLSLLSRSHSFALLTGIGITGGLNSQGGGNYANWTMFQYDLLFAYQRGAKFLGKCTGGVFRKTFFCWRMFLVTIYHLSWPLPLLISMRETVTTCSMYKIFVPLDMLCRYLQSWGLHW